MVSDHHVGVAGALAGAPLAGFEAGAGFGGADGRGFMNYAAYPGALGMNGLPGSRYTAGALSYGIPFPGASILDSMKTSNGKSNTFQISYNIR